MKTGTDETLLSKLEGVADAALLHEAMGKRGAMNHDIKPVYPGAKLFGRALTVRCRPSDNLMLHLAISVAERGDVLVATADGYLESGAWGDIASLAAQLRGVNGLIFDGAVRDVDSIARMDFPVFSRGISIKGTTKRLHGELNQPISIGGICVNPGDIVVGDSGGVVVVPAAEIDDVVVKAHAIIAKEEDIRQKLRQGASTLDLLGLRPVLKELGLNSD